MRAFGSSTVAAPKRVKHELEVHNKKYFEKDFVSTSIEELEFVRSPFYEIAALHHTKDGEESEQLLTDLATKINMIDLMHNALKSPPLTKEKVAFTRYADEVEDPTIREHF